ncbi:beta-N-acetylhexosaminidase [Lacibacter sediminis]|uniref:beta-N-acetylhexosaminidase n=1 Tax=Lacibacter sediminis TaxID=2760713 RepID=A0A7G5XCB9_9BACT|nr:beta-N-acetylhexosaminidase [Lacibacter sediminis]QNA43122.1 beta-N-acetylhexosaminidase [Lacibacter sediminis]
MQGLFSTVVFLLLFSVTNAQQLNNIIPKPVKTELFTSNVVVLQTGSVIEFDARFKEQANYLLQQLLQQCGLQTNLQISKVEKSKAAIVLQYDASVITKEEMYELTIQQQQVVIKARSIRGVMNGMQTLFQLLPLQKTEKISLPAGRITDYPRFAYRGMHLDVVRHMFPLDYIKKYIDYLTFHKFNTFHWHLTDDQGWRIEILSYPKLNSVGSWRDSTLIGHFKDTPARYEHKRYGGYYTRAEVKEIIAYATVRGITIIPEIDIPGHSRATITAYPEFSTDPTNKWGVAATWGMYNRVNNVLAPNPATFTFLRTVFHEIADLFPSPYIHVGGDECSKMWWKQSATTQQFIKDNKLKDEVALQTYFIEQVSKYLKEKKKKVIGWHEIMEGKLDTSTIVMNWANDAKAIEAAGKGFNVIMTPGKPYYFDHFQSKDPKDSLAIHGYNSLQVVYNYDLVPASIKQKGLAHKILGGQANVWTEYMEWSTKVDYMVFPRMTAVSESLWSQPAQKNYTDFIRRLKANIIPRYQYWNSSWFKGFETWTADK